MLTYSQWAIDFLRVDIDVAICGLFFAGGHLSMSILYYAERRHVGIVSRIDVNAMEENVSCHTGQPFVRTTGCRKV